MSWLDQAACQSADPTIFFPEPGFPAARAKRICGRCPVTAECLAYAQDNAADLDGGIFGGLSAAERERERPPRPEPEHGTRKRYKTRDCRCDLCRDANRAYSRAYYHRGGAA